MPEFPNDFDRVSGIDISDAKINEWVQELISDTPGTWITSGNTIAIKTNGNQIIIAKNYWVFDPEEYL